MMIEDAPPSADAHQQNFDSVARSIAPSIVGHRYLKAFLALLAVADLRPPADDERLDNTAVVTPVVIALTGPARCGKTTLLAEFAAVAPCAWPNAEGSLTKVQPAVHHPPAGGLYDNRLTAGGQPVVQQTRHTPLLPQRGGAASSGGGMSQVEAVFDAQVAGICILDGNALAAGTSSSHTASSSSSSALSPGATGTLLQLCTVPGAFDHPPFRGLASHHQAAASGPPTVASSAAPLSSLSSLAAGVLLLALPEADAAGGASTSNRGTEQRARELLSQGAALHLPMPRRVATADDARVAASVVNGFSAPSVVPDVSGSVAGGDMTSLAARLTAGGSAAVPGGLPGCGVDGPVAPSPGGSAHHPHHPLTVSETRDVLKATHDRLRGLGDPSSSVTPQAPLCASTFVIGGAWAPTQATTDTAQHTTVIDVVEALLCEISASLPPTAPLVGLALLFERLIMARAAFDWPPIGGVTAASSAQQSGLLSVTEQHVQDVAELVRWPVGSQAASHSDVREALLRRQGAGGGGGAVDPLASCSLPPQPARNDPCGSEQQQQMVIATRSPAASVTRTMMSSQWSQCLASLPDPFDASTPSTENRQHQRLAAPPVTPVPLTSTGSDALRCSPGGVSARLVFDDVCRQSCAAAGHQLQTPPVLLMSPAARHPSPQIGLVDSAVVPQKRVSQRAFAAQLVDRLALLAQSSPLPADDSFIWSVAQQLPDSEHHAARLDSIVQRLRLDGSILTRPDGTLLVRRQ